MYRLSPPELGYADLILTMGLEVMSGDDGVFRKLGISLKGDYLKWMALDGVEGDVSDGKEDSVDLGCKVLRFLQTYPNIFSSVSRSHEPN